MSACVKVNCVHVNICVKERKTGGGRERDRERKREREKDKEREVQ